MPNKWQAQQNFWSSFGLAAYDQNTVPNTAKMPYITYEAFSGGLGTVQTTTASIWYRSKSWAEISLKADEIAQKINAMPPATSIDGGMYKVRIPLDMPFAQRMEEPDDADVRRVVLHVEVEFLTAY